MSEQTNFGKGALITGIVLGVAVGGFGAYTLSSNTVERPQTALNGDGAKAAAALTQVAEQAVAERKKNHAISDVAPEGAEVNGKPRYTPIFFSPELWQVTLDADKKNTVIDIYDPTAPNIHADVPNHWFITNGIADALGVSDGLAQDSDADGFSNREEFDAGTHPNDAASLPALVQAGKAPKLEVVEVAEASAVIGVDSALAYDAQPTVVGIRIFAKPGDPRPLYRFNDLKVGDSFGLTDKESDKRFTIVAFQKEDYAGLEESVVLVRDNVTAGAEKEFTIRSGTPTKVGARDFGTPSAKGRVIKDTTVKLRVTAGAKTGEEFSVQLSGTFKVPGTDISCKLESIDAAGSVNVLPEGVESPVNVPKAGE